MLSEDRQRPARRPPGVRLRYRHSLTSGFRGQGDCTLCRDQQLQFDALGASVAPSHGPRPGDACDDQSLDPDVCGYEPWSRMTASASEELGVNPKTVCVP